MSRGSSPTLIGRDADLRRLREAVAAARAETGSVILVSGEAGIGKSRLLAEFESSFDADPSTARPVRFLHASCLETGARLPYLPIIDWLGELQTSGDDRATQLLQTFSGAEPSTIGIDGAVSGRSTQFLRLRDLLAALAADVDLVAIIDDLHWADRSTLDVVAFLARRLPRTGAVLVASYRSDELHRRHPLTPVLAEIERRSTIDHIRLEPLGPSDVARQIAAIEGAAAEPGRAAQVVGLADGNPFHVEELLALDRPGPLPATLHDVLSARLAAVDDETVSVLREAAVIGRRVDVELLELVSRADATSVAASSRTALEALILVADDDGRHVSFRHALLREAVYDDVLPSDRIELHRRIATCLMERPDLGDPAPAAATADLARHWLAAGVEQEAFAALLAAGLAASAAAAWAEARWAYEQALALWDRVPDASRIAGVPRSRITGDASIQAWYEGDTRRALELIRRARVESDVQADPRRPGRLLTYEAWFLGELGDMAAARAAVEQAIGTLPIEPPSWERVEALGSLGVMVLGEGRVAEAIAILEAACTTALVLDNPSVIAANRAFLSSAYAEMGRAGDAAATLAAARLALASADVSAPPGTAESAYFAVSTNAPWVWLSLGRYEHAVAESDAYLADSRRRGLDAATGIWLTSTKALAEYHLGRWDAAISTIDASSVYASSAGPACFQHAVLARIRAGRGELSEARRAAEASVGLARERDQGETIASALSVAWTELLAGEPVAAARILSPQVDAWPDPRSSAWLGELAWVCAWVSAELDLRVDTSDRDRGVGLATFASRMVALRNEGDALRDGIDPWLDMAEAELERGAGRDDPQRWASAAADLERIGDIPAAAVARHREAAALLDRGDRGPAAQGALRAAIAHADAMGATLLHAHTVELARAARLRLGPMTREPDGGSPSRREPTRPGDAWGLSPREREVLTLLIDGRTNVQIGQALFISDKTASVHVTHILDKLGVSSRVEAALLAVRSGFVGPASEP